jgi:predicted component of type VI protein secretion system
MDQVDVCGFEVLAESFLNAASSDEVLARVVVATEALVPNADLVSVTVHDEDGGLSTPVASAAEAERLDRIQFRLREGPCVDATGSAGNCVFVPDLTAARQWPRFAPAAAERGLESLLAVPIRVSSPGPGPAPHSALNVYSRHRLAEAACRTARLVASHGGLALAAVEALVNGERRADQLRAAVQSRDVIGQAKGLLMERHGLTGTEAFQTLSHASQHLNIKLFALAETLVAGHALALAVPAPPGTARMDPETRQLHIKALNERIQAAYERAELAAARRAGLARGLPDPASAEQAQRHSEQAARALRESLERRAQALTSAAAAHEILARQLETHAARRLSDLGVAAWHRAQAAHDRDQARTLAAGADA